MVYFDDIESLSNVIIEIRLYNDGLMNKKYIIIVFIKL